MHGTIIVIEGLDGCGKSTQLELLKEQFTDCRFITFPNYESPSGQLVTQYLQGAFHEKNPLRSAYSASSFYAADRYASFKQDWEKDYLSGKTIISARYTTSNAFYQMTKLPPEEWEAYRSWLYDFEYGKLGIPKPDAVIFLDVPIEVSQRLLSQRYDGNEEKKDIHEADVNYLKACRNAAMYTRDHSPEEQWFVISCCENGEMRSIAEIQAEIADIVHRVRSNTGIGYAAWDNAEFTLPDAFHLHENSTLSDALHVFYAAGGYDFFKVTAPETYAGNWLDFVGALYADIAEGIYQPDGQPYDLPLSAEQRQSLASQGVPEIFWNTQEN